MRKEILASLVAVAVVVGLVLWSQLIAPSLLGAQQSAGCGAPKSWGALRGGAPFLTFEATDGTLRIVNMETCRIEKIFTRSQ